MKGARIARNAFGLLAGTWLLLMLTACGTEVRRVEVMSPEAQLVTTALQHWPKVPRGGEGITRTFFATFHAVGQRTTASGVLEYYGPRDFRITAVTEMGALLFDVRMNWAGVTVRRHMTGLEAGIVESLVNDLSRGFELPDELGGLAAAKDKLILKKTLGDGHTVRWTFDAASGRLLQTDVPMGLLDTLHIEFPKYTPAGAPAEMRVERKARLYDISLTFTEPL